MQTTHPHNQAIRDHMRNRIEQQRSAEHQPPPSPEEIRRQLGWSMIKDGERDPFVR